MSIATAYTSIQDGSFATTGLFNRRFQLLHDIASAQNAELSGLSTDASGWNAGSISTTLNTSGGTLSVLTVRPASGNTIPFLGAVSVNTIAPQSGTTITVSAGTLAAPTYYPIESGETGVADVRYPVGDIRRYGASQSLADNAASVRLANSAAVALRRGGIHVPPSRWTVESAITLSPGVTIYGDSATGEYEGGIPSGIAWPSTLIRSGDGLAGPLIVLNTSTAVRNLSLKHLKASGATSGIIQVGAWGNDQDSLYNAVTDVHIIGSRTTDVSGTSTCYGIFFPDSRTTGGAHARFYNRFSDVHITECDVGVHLGGQSNANTFTNIVTRECHVHYDLNGGPNSCIENTFAAIAAFQQSAGMNPAPTVFKLRNARNNVFLGYVTESQGTLWDTDPTCVNNRFEGTSNEVTQSYLSGSNADLTYARPVNASGYASMLVPTNVAGTRNTFGRGNRLSFIRPITGTLPDTNRVDGTLAVGDASVKKIVSFGAAYTKSGLLSMACKLRVFGYGPGDAGMHLADVEFLVRNTNFSTGDAALNVLSVVSNKGGRIAGLHFLSGVSSGDGFGIALVGGGSGGATAFDAITVGLEVDAVTYSTHVVDMSALAGLAFTTASLSSSDVSDGISLYAVADTAF